MKERSHHYHLPDGTTHWHREKESRVMQQPRLTPLSAATAEKLSPLYAAAAKCAAWDNGAYYGVLAWFETGSPLGGGTYAILSISSTLELAVHDWRDYQQLKNLLVGEEWEAVELYPAESRLVDPSNRFYLWCFPRGVITWGLPERRLVLDMEESLAPQRPFPPGK